jgi:putative transposase
VAQGAHAVKRACKLRAYPTRPQEGRATRLLADHCDLYNAALLERREAWRMARVGVTYGMQPGQLKEIRRADPDGQGRHSFTAQQQTLRRLNVVFQAFYARAKQGKAGFPRFKPHQWFGSVTFVAGDGAKWCPREGKWAHATFQGVGTVKVQQHRPLPGTVKTLTLKRDGRRWYVVVVTDAEPKPLPATGRSVGVDLGVARFLTTSDGEIVANPGFAAQAAETVAGLQRRIEQAQRGSGNRKRLRRVLAREWRKVANQRRDFHHKVARSLVDSCDVIALEKLNTAGMSRRPRPKPDPDTPGGFLRNMAAAKAALTRKILDAGWAQFTNISAGKAEEAGRRVLFVNPAGTSIHCHLCGTRCERPRQDTVICPEHGELDADWNGAKNVETRAGLGSGQDAQAA